MTAHLTPGAEDIPAFETVILGGGPAGTGSLVWAARHGLLGDWLDAGVAVIERSAKLGGSLYQYALSADSRGMSFLEGLEGPRCDPLLVDLRTDPVTRELEHWRHGRPPLPLVDRFQRRLTAALQTEFDRHPSSCVLTETTASSIQLLYDGTVVVRALGRESGPASIRAASAVVALGGRENTSWEQVELAPDISLARWHTKVIPSHRLLAGDADEVGRSVGYAKLNPRVVIVGGSHNAFVSAWILLERMPWLDFDLGGLQILYRGEPRVMYPSRAEAHSEGYRFTEADVCQLTGRVHRHGGLRGDGREMWRRMHGKIDGEPDDRAVARPIRELSRTELIRLFDDADLIVSALGYRMATLPVFDPQGVPIALPHTGALVGPDSRLLAADGAPLPGLFGVGLGTGFLPSGAMGGEASFTGSHASVWEDQHGLGEMIYRGVREHARTGVLAKDLAAVAVSAE